MQDLQEIKYRSVNWCVRDWIPGVAYYDLFRSFQKYGHDRGDDGSSLRIIPTDDKHLRTKDFFLTSLWICEQVGAASAPISYLIGKSAGAF